MYLYSLLFLLVISTVKVRSSQILSPRSIKIIQKDGKDIKVQWSIQQESLTLMEAKIFKEGKKGDEDQLVAQWVNGKDRGISDNMMIISLANLTLLISPYNSSVHQSQYYVLANFTKEDDRNETFTDKTYFQLVTRSEEIISTTQRSYTGYVGNKKVKDVITFIVLGGSAIIAIIVLVGLVIYRAKYIHESVYSKEDNMTNNHLKPQVIKMM